jgi:sugar phosphate permease
MSRDILKLFFQTSLWGRWAPQNERTIIVGVPTAAAIFGISISNIATSAICENLGWPYAFYIYGAFGIFFGIVWIIYFRNTPEEMPWCLKEEKEFIKANTTASARINIKEIPFRKILTSFVFWVACMSNIANSVIFFSITDKLPEYLQERREIFRRNEASFRVFFASFLPAIFLRTADLKTNNLIFLQKNIVTTMIRPHDPSIS